MLIDVQIHSILMHKHVICIKYHVQDTNTQLICVPMKRYQLLYEVFSMKRNVILA